MKLWASASFIGLSMAYLVGACSSSPPDTVTPTPSAGAPGAGAPGGGAPGAGAPGGGAPPLAGAGGGVPVTGGAGGAGGTGGGSAAGAAGTAGAGGAATGEGPCPANVLGHCDAGVTIDSYPKYPGYTLALVEDFPAAMDLDTDPIFTWSDGAPADGQTRFRKEQIVFANGRMQIKAESPCAAQTGNSGCVKAMGYKSYAEPAKDQTTGALGDLGVWSGEFRTRYNNYRYGRYEAKFKAPTANPGMETVPNAAGGFLSTLFVFRSPKWQIWNEIDIELEGSIPTSLAGNVLNVAGRTAYPSDVNNAFVTTMGLPAGYKNVDEHVYAFTWTPTSIDWYVDGQPARSFKGGAATAGNVPIPTVSAKIMMNLWVFAGNPFGTSGNNKYPMQSEYDYFHFYKLDTEPKYPCAPVPGCLDATDKTASAQNNPTEMNYGM